MPTASSGAAGIGASFSVQDPDGDAYTVTLDKVIDPARSSNPYLAPDSGTRFAAAVFTIRARGASLQNEDANDCASAAGSDGQSYSPGFAPISKYTNFDNGTIHAAQHQAVTGEIYLSDPGRREDREGPMDVARRLRDHRAVGHGVSRISGDSRNAIRVGFLAGRRGPDREEDQAEDWLCCHRSLPG